MLMRRVPLNTAPDGNRLPPAVDALQKGFHLQTSGGGATLLSVQSG